MKDIPATTASADDSASTSDMARRAVLRGAAGLAVGTVTAAATASEVAAGPASGSKAASTDTSKDAAAQDPLLRRKQLRMFEVLDVDGDGVVTPPDTVRIAQKLARLTGTPLTSPRVRQVITAIEEIWHTLVTNPVDVPDPRRLDAEQFVTVMANRISTMPDMTLLYIGVLTNLTFAMLDGDNDSLMTKEDSVRAEMEIAKISRDEAEETWAIFNTADPRHMTYEECLVLVTDFITSTDPQAPGNSFLGRF